MNINELYTPCLIVDYEKLKTNINRMQKHIAGLGVTLRPHVKTAKSPDIAKMFEGGIHSPITVSTLKEAEYFLDAGFKDIIYAVSMVPEKLSRAKAIMENGADLKLIIDDSEIAKKINSFGEKNKCVFKVMIEIDSDMHRAGLSPDAPEVVEIAHILHHGLGTEFIGVLTHAGESYG